MRARVGFFGIVDVLHVTPQIRNASEERRAKFAHESFLLGMHNQMAGQVRFLLKTDVAGVTLVLLPNHVISFMLVESGHVGKGFEADVASERVRPLRVDGGFFRMSLFDMPD